MAVAIVRAVRDIAVSDDSWEISSVKEVGDQGKSDVHWITKFAQEGGDAILSADKDFLKTPPQVMAVSQTGMKVIYLPPQWQNAEGRLQASHILLWWKRIEQAVADMKLRECYKPPWNISETGKMVKVDIDYHGANQKLKKANRRSD